MNAPSLSSGGQVRKPEDARPPLTTVDAYLKGVDVRAMTDRSRRTFELAYSGFLDPVLPDESGDQERTVMRIRRYAGKARLARGRYWSLCQNAGGDDDGTLRSELGAYYEPYRVGPILCAEVELIPGHIADAYQAAGYPLPEHGRALDMIFPPPHVDVLPFLPAGAPHWFVPLRVEHRRMENVLDLRQVEAAEWFAHHASRLDLVQPVDPVDCLAELLPLMIIQARGGDTRCTAIGTWLRQLGVHVLIYPSARFDASVRVERGRVTAWQGWNLVEYGPEPLPDSATGSTTTDSAPHPQPFMGSGRVRIVTRKGDLEGTWLIEGLLAVQRRRIEDGVAAFRRRLGGKPPAPDTEDPFAMIRDAIGALERADGFDSDPSSMDPRRMPR